MRWSYGNIYAKKLDTKGMRMVNRIIEKIIVLLDMYFPISPAPVVDEPSDLSGPHYIEAEDEFGDALLGLHYHLDEDGNEAS